MVKTAKKNQYYEGVGRRKASVARVRLYITGKEKEVVVNEKSYAKGTIMVNGKAAEDYFTGKANKARHTSPFIVTDTLDRFVTFVHVVGGGTTGQVESILLGISRALLKVDLDYRPRLKEEELLTRDPRIRERRKVGTGGKARRAKQSPKR